MTTSPKVTVLVPVFNGEKYLRECLDSILGQTFTDFECLVINDASTDGSAALVKSIPDRRIRYVENEKNAGIANTRNRGLQLARGEYVAFCDCDDVIVPNRLERQVAFMEANPEVGISGGFMERILANGEMANERWSCPLDHKTIARYLAVTCTLWNPTLIIRKSVVVAHALYHDPAYVAASDLEWYIRMVRVTRSANIGEVLTYYRQHEQQITSASILVSRLNAYNLHLGLMLEEIKKLRPHVKGEVKPVTAEMTEHPLPQNLELLIRIMRDWPVPDDHASEAYFVYQAIKECLVGAWRTAKQHALGSNPGSVLSNAQ